MIPDPRAVRRTLLDALFFSGAGHLGSAMSTVEMLIAMYASVDVAAIKNGEANRPRIVISKGHCAAAVYSVLFHYGLLSKELLDTYYQEGSVLTGLVCHDVPGVEHSTGSLGHGLSVAAGMALAQRSVPVLCLCGDGELQEGSNWETLLLVKHLNMTNLVVLVDDNRIQMIDRTEKIIDMRPLTRRFSGLGFATVAVNGHDVEAILRAIRLMREQTRPGVIICRTVKGKGYSLAEDDPMWHYKVLTAEQHKEAMADLA